MGLSGEGPVTVTEVRSYGAGCIEVAYDVGGGRRETRLLWQSDEGNLEIAEDRLPWSFDGDGNQLRLASEAYRIRLAYLFDPYLAVHTSSVEPLPHQISAVYREMLPRLPLRFLLADDPGAGKTIMTGLFIKEMIARSALRRCLIVAPGSLVEQWQDEMFLKFRLRFKILTKEEIEASVTGNIFREIDLCICRLDQLSRSEKLQEMLKATDWDLIVCDEAHKMSATIWGNEPKYTKRFRLGELLSGIAKNFLLLTATPHNGKAKDFQLFLSLIDPDRFGPTHDRNQPVVDTSDVMRRLVKENLLKFDGTPLFPERIAYTVKYDLSPLEAGLYDDVTNYVREEFNRADSLENERKNNVGFALTILQRRLASSPEAIYQSLRRRRERLERRLAEEQFEKSELNTNETYYADFDEDDLTPDEWEAMQENVVDRASAAKTISELEAEIETLKHLEQSANNVRKSGVDRKWDELSRLLQDNELMFGEEGKREKLIIFTEHKDTLNYLAGKIRSLLGRSESVITIHGGMPRDERRKAEQLFKQDSDVRVLVATDAAGEGINLQRAHLMINYDLPWNPNRLEQRFGRIHRIGQTEVCHLWNLVASDTREGFVFDRLFSKLEEERKALGGKVFDILGKMTFDNKSLRELLIEAVRYGEKPEVKERLSRVVDSTLDRGEFERLINDNALAEDVMDIHMVSEIKEDMDRMEVRKLQPYFIEAFFTEAFKSLGGKIRDREKGRFEITRVPFKIREHASGAGRGGIILEKYERVCFDKEYCNLPNLPDADLICPGHPLLDSVIDLILERERNVMKQGAVFIDDNDYSNRARVLFYIEDSLRDEVDSGDGNKRIISKNIHFIEIDRDGNVSDAGYAPYLDYRAAADDEKARVLEWMKSEPRISPDLENSAKAYSAMNIIPKHLETVKSRRIKMLDKTEKAVEERLTAEVNYWDLRASEIRQKEQAGEENLKLSYSQAHQRANELQARKDMRLAEIQKEKEITSLPPDVTGGALIIPKGLLDELTGGDTGLFSDSSDDRRTIESAAMNAVMEIERGLGYEPKDVSAAKCGYDIESAGANSQSPGERSVRFIEVKGRSSGAKTVTITSKEICTALNNPERFILAIVEVDGDVKHTTYLKEPFKAAPEFTAVSINYNIQELIRDSQILYRT